MPPKATIDLALTFSRSSRRRVGGAKGSRLQWWRRARVPLGSLVGYHEWAEPLMHADAVLLHAPCAPSLPETQLAPVVCARPTRLFFRLGTSLFAGVVVVPSCPAPACTSNTGADRAVVGPAFRGPTCRRSRVPYSPRRRQR